MFFYRVHAALVDMNPAPRQQRVHAADALNNRVIRVDRFHGLLHSQPPVPELNLKRSRRRVDDSRRRPDVHRALVYEPQQVVRILAVVFFVVPVGPAVPVVLIHNPDVLPIIPDVQVHHRIHRAVVDSQEPAHDVRIFVYPVQLLIPEKQVVRPGIPIDRTLGHHPEPLNVPLIKHAGVHGAVPFPDLFTQRRVVVHKEVYKKQLLLRGFFYPILQKPVHRAVRVTVKPHFSSRNGAPACGLVHKRLRHQRHFVAVEPRQRDALNQIL